MEIRNKTNDDFHVSYFPTLFPEKLTNPAFQYEGEGFRRSSSNTSLNSILSPEGEDHIRTCEECRVLLERRDQQIEQRNRKPHIVLIYEVSVVSFRGQT
jgi:rabenosyn-5